jgi:hypothetical protein
LISSIVTPRNPIAPSGWIAKGTKDRGHAALVKGSEKVRFALVKGSEKLASGLVNGSENQHPAAPGTINQQ